MKRLFVNLAIVGCFFIFSKNLSAEIYSDTEDFVSTQGYSYNYPWDHTLSNVPDGCSITSATIEVRAKVWSWGWYPYEQDILASDTISFNYSSGYVCSLDSSTHPNPSNFYTINCPLSSEQINWIANDNEIHFIMTTSGGTYYLDHSTLTIECSVLPTYDLTVTKNGPGTGLVTSTDDGIDCGVDCSETYLQDTSVFLDAAAEEFSYFQGWSGPCTGTDSCTMSITENTGLTASFGLRGDFDSDDDLDLSDLIISLRIISNHDGSANLLADTDDDGKVTLADSLFILGRVSE